MPPKLYLGSPLTVALAALLQGLPAIHRLASPPALAAENAQASQVLAGPLRPADLSVDEWNEVLGTLSIEDNSPLSHLLNAAAKLAAGPAPQGKMANFLYSIFNDLGQGSGKSLTVPPRIAGLSDATF